jgi:hypothetical protein
MDEFTYDLGLGSVPELNAVATENILRSEHLPEGYTVVVNERGIIIIYDEIGVPLGYIIPREGETLQSILMNARLLEEMTPFLKVNPQTDVRGSDFGIAWMLFLLILPVLLKGMLIIRRRRKHA